MLIPWRSFEPFDEFDKLMASFGKDAPISFSPAVDIYEEDNTLVVETSLAGVSPEKVNVNIEDNILTIEGKAEKKTEVDEKNYYRREVRTGSFYRQIPLPATVEGGKAVAEFKDGILKIAVPKIEDKKSSKIEIKIKK